MLAETILGDYVEGAKRQILHSGALCIKEMPIKNKYECQTTDQPRSRNNKTHASVHPDVGWML